MGLLKKFVRAPAWTRGSSGFIDGGYVRLERAVVEEIRPVVMEEFRLELAQRRGLGRWLLRRKVARIVANRVRERLSMVSDGSLF